MRLKRFLCAGRGAGLIAENDSTLLAELGELGRQGRYTPRIERDPPADFGFGAVDAFAELLPEKELPAKPGARREPLCAAPSDAPPRVRQRQPCNLIPRL
jgi:hypothetical protein